MEPPLKQRRPVIVVFSQSLHGVGHYVRSCRLGGALTEIATIYIVNGGRRMPRHFGPLKATVVDLPGLQRDSMGRILPELSGISLQKVRHLRREEIKKILGGQQIDVLIIEYFPFQRLQFAGEIVFLIDLIKKSNASCVVCCSVRDFPRPAETKAQADFTRALLLEHFDAVMAHGDPAVCGQHPPFSDSVFTNRQVPISFTGYIANDGSVADCSYLASRHLGDFQGAVVVSAGGGVDGYPVFREAIVAWKEICDHRDLKYSKMVLCLGAFLSAELAEKLRDDAQHVPRVHIIPFISEFQKLLQIAAVSISRAGYNTCVDSLLTKSKSIFIPSHAVSDQVTRAERLSSMGFGAVVQEGPHLATLLAAAILRSIHEPKPSISVCLNGISVSREIIKNMLSTGDASDTRLPRAADIDFR